MRHKYSFFLDSSTTTSPPTTTTTPAACQEGWTRYEDACYTVMNNWDNQYDDIKYCRLIQQQFNPPITPITSGITVASWVDTQGASTVRRRTSLSTLSSGKLWSIKCQKINEELPNMSTTGKSLASICSSPSSTMFQGSVLGRPTHEGTGYKRVKVILFNFNLQANCF